MIKPVNNNILLKKEKIEKITSSGILLSQKDEPDYAKVVAVADVIKNDNGDILNILVGAKVLYKNYSPTKVNYNNEEYLLIDAKDILAIIE